MYYFVYTNAPDSPSYLLAIYNAKNVDALESIRKEWDQRYGGYYEIREGTWSGDGKIPEYKDLTYVKRRKNDHEA